ncbi:MAG: glycosyltransferase [Cytophaga sp.]|uniref:glycosyltransferase n=1 Tax=Cytophaga sp. TaxID=29535 RepID=UPI003F807A02
MNGVSVIICCHNSAHILPETLTYLSRQIVLASLKWELILVDNASSDNTAAVAEQCWKALDKPVEMRIVQEKTPGLSFARQAGIQAAVYDIILFCDDDNLLNADYIQLGFDAMAVDASIALLGGKGQARMDIQAPDWFDRYAYQYAVGAQAACSKDITIERGFVYGAGCFMRMHAYKELQQAGFQYTLSGRTGKSLLSGEDNELGYAFSLIGFTIHYNERLHFTHVLAANRLTFSYLKKLKKAVAYSSVLLTPYIEKRNEILFNKASTFNWTSQLLRELLFLLNGYIKYPFASANFKIDILLDRQARLGKILGLYKNRRILQHPENWLPWLQ